MENKLEALSIKCVEKNELKEVKLPLWPKDKRGTPNTFLRSALFSAIQSKDRVDLKGAIMASQNGIVVKYTGEQLNQEDLTLWEALVHLAKNSPLGDICEFTAYEILRSMRLGTGIGEYKTLHLNITRLTACAVEINKEGSDRGFLSSLIEFGETHDIESTTRYKLKLSRTLTRLYKDNTTWIDFGQRIKLKRKPLAQFLHGYYSSHLNPYPVKITTLHKLSGGKTKSQIKFKQSIKAALDELVKIDFLDGYEIEDDLLSVTRK